MIRIPNSYQGSNIHRVVITQQNLTGTDYERIQDIAADAVAEARAAVEAFETFPNGACHATLRRFREVKLATERRSVLVDAFFSETPAILSHLAKLSVPDEDASLHEAATRHFRTALDLAHRVRDLVAAERDICRRMETNR